MCNNRNYGKGGGQGTGERREEKEESGTFAADNL